MLAFVRAACAAALVLLLSIPAIAADKSFRRDDLTDAAIKLEAQIKGEAGQVTKPAAALRREADAAFQRNDFRSGMQILGQIVTVAPDDSANWLRLAKAVLQIRPSNDREKTLLLERAATAAYIAYQRSSNPSQEAESLVVVGRSFGDRSIWRPALDALRVSLDLREVAEVRQQYERMREDHGFRLLDYSVDADAASPRACFQFSEDLPGKRADFSPFVTVAGQDKPALSVARPSALCRGSQARRALRHHAARRHPFAGEGDAVEIRRLQHLRARPQTAGAFHRQGLRAAAQRTARHSRRERQYHGGRTRDLPHRRPQSSGNRGGTRIPAHPRSLRPQPPDRGARLPGLEGRDDGRADAQYRRHHGLPGRSGHRRAVARRVRRGGAAGRGAQGRFRIRLRPSGSSSPTWA